MTSAQGTRATMVLAAFVLLFAQAHSLPRERGATFLARDGSPHTIAELRGHPAVINFWATWCGPCKEEMPRLQGLADRYAAQGVRFIAVSLDSKETQDRIDTTVSRRGFRVPVWTGASDRTLKDLELGDLVPATLIIDENGGVVGKIEGEAREKDISSRLDWVLGGRQGKAPKGVVRNDW